MYLIETKIDVTFTRVLTFFLHAINIFVLRLFFLCSILHEHNRNSLRGTWRLKIFYRCHL